MSLDYYNWKQFNKEIYKRKEVDPEPVETQFEYKE